MSYSLLFSGFSIASSDEKAFQPDGIDALHKQASGWFSEKGQIEEALYNSHQLIQAR